MKFSLGVACVPRINTTSILCKLIAGDNTISSELKELKRLIIYIMRRIEGIELHLNKMSNIQNDHKRSLLQTVNLPLTELVQLQSLEEKLSNNEFRNEMVCV